MTEFWGVVGVAVLLAAACAAAIKLALESRDDRVASAKLAGRVDALTKDNGDLVRQLGAEAAAHVDTRARLEAVIAQQKTEIARLEGELDHEMEPTAVRERLGSSGLLLGGAQEGTALADRAAAAAGLPPRPASDVGAAGGGPGR